MATRPDTTSAFIAKLLAPLPEGAEPVETAQVRSEAKATIKERYWFAWNRAEMAWHKFQAAHREGILVRVGNTEQSWAHSNLAEYDAARAYIDAMSEMMRVPALTRDMLADKRARRRRWKTLTLPDTRGMLLAANQRWDEYLTEDEARFAAH